MRLFRSILLLVYILFVVLACGGTLQPEMIPKGPFYLQSIRPLQVKIVDIEEDSFAMNFLRKSGMLEDAQVGDTRNICTINSIDQGRHLWLTAAHCVVDIGNEGRYVEGSPVEMIDVRPSLDLAIVRVVGISVPGLSLASQGPGWVEEILIVGHPHGYDPVFITKGIVSNPRATLGSGAFMVFNVAAAPGNSGSAVLNLKGEIVSVLQIGWCQSFCPVTAGATYENLRQFKQYFTPAILAVETPQGIGAQPGPESWD